MPDSSTPLWLDIKTEYIDENFEKVLNYLRNASQANGNKDSFYDKTVELLSTRTQELLDELESRPVYEDNDAEKDRNKFAVRLLGAYLLVNIDETDTFRRRVCVTLFSCLSLLVPSDQSRELVEYAVKYLLGKAETKISLSWEDLITFQPQVLSARISNQNVFDRESGITVSYDNKGILDLANGVISVASVDRTQTAGNNLVSALSVFDDQIQILSSKSDKLKKTETDIEKLDQFTREFIKEQRAASPCSDNTLKSYAEGDRIPVYVEGFATDAINVIGADTEYEPFHGQLKILHPILYYNIQNFSRYLKDGDCIEVDIVNLDQSICSVDRVFKEYIVDDLAREDFGNQVLAQFFTENIDRTGTRKIVWWTDRGYPAFSPYVEGLNKGDVAYIQITSHGRDDFYAYINAEFVEKVNEPFDYEDARRYAIEGLLIDPPTSKEHTDTLERGLVKEICRMLVGYQKGLAKPSERYKFLCVARILAELIENEIDSSYIDFVSEYLENLVFFAKGDIDKIKELNPAAYIADLCGIHQRIDIVRTLKCFGDDSCNDELSDTISTTDDPLLKKVAILVQSCNRIDDVISKSMQNVIKREIIKALAIETEGDTDLEEDNGIYLGIEDSRQEFKTSFFHAPTNAREQNQKLTIFKGICAFLNSQAPGTLYLGVDDLGYVKGIDGDLEYLERNVNGNYHGVDGYIRHITDEAKKFFDLGILTHIDIKPMYDGKVVAINIQPYEYNVVTFNNVAYYRLNNESIVMPEAVKRQLLDRRIFANKEKAANVSAVMKAIRDKRQVIFHGYSSSSSGEKRDRHLEAFAFSTGFTHIHCYDLEKERNAIFSTDRISNVEVTSTPWEKENLHKQAPMDAFHMTGDQPIHVVLKLNLRAKNLLVEEYPDAKTSLVVTDNDGEWLLDTNIYRIEGLGRFYLGLAADIEIIDAPVLKEYVKVYKESYL